MKAGTRVLQRTARSGASPGPFCTLTMVSKQEPKSAAAAGSQAAFGHSYWPGQTLDHERRVPCGSTVATAASPGSLHL